MVEINLTLKVVSPLALHQSRASVQFSPTLDYIPGSTLRGALAELYLEGDPDRAQMADFRALFLEDQVFYPDLLPATNPGDPWHLVPATAWACKRFGEEHSGSVTDTLLRLELAETLRDQGRSDWHTPLEDVEECPVCRKEHPGPAENRPRGWYAENCVDCTGGSRTARTTAEFTQHSASCPRDRAAGHYAHRLDPAFLPGKVWLRLRTGTAIDRATGAVASGMLFSQQVIDSDQQFTGRLWLADSQADSLEKLLTTLAPERSTLYLGYGRSRGLGHVEVIGWQPAATATPPLADRWKSFNRAVQRLWARYQAGTPGDLYFSLTLLSHLALRDECAQPVLDRIQPADLGLPWAMWGWRHLDAVAVPGWNAAWRMPKPDTWALQRGSVLLGRIPPEQEAATLDRLAELEVVGAGDRRAEGLGRLRACDEFHYTYTLQELRQEVTA